MNMSEILELVIEVAQSGRPGAAVKILQDVKEAIDNGKTDSHVFTHNVAKLINIAQDRAFEEEYALKGKHNDPMIDEMLPDLIA